MPLVSLPRELSANPQFSPNWEFVKSQMKSFIREQKPDVLTKGENKAAAFTHLQQNSEESMYCPVSIFTFPGGNT